MGLIEKFVKDGIPKKQMVLTTQKQSRALGIETFGLRHFSLGLICALTGLLISSLVFLMELLFAHVSSNQFYPVDIQQKVYLLILKIT